MKEEKKKILVVDDEPDIREILITVLRKDYSPQPAEDGKTAWDELSKNNGSSSLLITDGWNLPGINGYELTELVRKDKRYVNMPVIMVSARKEEKYIQLAKKATVDVYILKPFSYKEILFVVRAFPYKNPNIREEGIKRILERTKPSGHGNIILFPNGTYERRTIDANLS